MARGTSSKTAITSKILEIFPDAFINEKEIRIPWVENGENLQIKCVLTCAKDNVIPAGKENSISKQNTAIDFETIEPDQIQPSAAEKEKVNELLQKLGITT